MKYHVERSITVKTPVEKIKPFIEDFKNWNLWSPWTIIEPDCSMEITGNPGETGHSMSWNGQIIGSGKNTLIKASNNVWEYDLRFFKPFKSKAKTSLILKEENGNTKVTWTMDSSLPFFLFFMLTKMKNWIEMDYHRGLLMLKEVAEKGGVNSSTVNNGVVDLEGFSYIGIERTVPMEKLPETMPGDFDKLLEEVVIKRGKSAKNWVTLYPKIDMKTMNMTYIAAVSDEELEDEDLGSEYVKGMVKDCKALEIKHDGAYDFIGNAWSMGMMYLRAKKIKGGSVPFEQYWNSPKEVQPHELKTSIFFPLK